MKKIDFSFLEHTSLYGPPPEHVYRDENKKINQQQVLYGPPPENVCRDVNETTVQKQDIYEPTSENNNIPLKTTSIGMWIVLFILGICAVFSRKMSKISKVVVIVSIIAIGLVITIALNCSYLAMERMLKNVNILKIDKISSIIYYGNNVANILKGGLFL